MATIDRKKIDNWWLYMWLGFILPLLFVSMFKGQFSHSFSLFLQGLVAVIAIKILKFPKSIGWILVRASLTILFLLTSFGWIYGAFGFHQEDHFWQHLRKGSLLPRTLSVAGQQLWQIETNEDLVWTFDAKLLDGKTGWNWQRSRKGIEMSYLSQLNAVNFKVSDQADANIDAHVSRSYELSEPLAGRTFRLQLEYRFRSHAQDKAYVMATGGGRFPLNAASLEWQKLELDWKAQNVDSQRLRVIVRELDGLELDLRNLRVWEFKNSIWEDLGAGIGFAMQLRARGEETLQSEIVLKDVQPSLVWRNFKLDIPAKTAFGKLQTQVLLAENLNIQLRNSHVKTITGREASRDLFDVRQKLWFPNSNLAAHSTLILALGLLSSSASLLVIGFTGSMALITILLMGSRAALFCLVIWGLSLVVFKKKHFLKRSLALGVMFLPVVGFIGMEVIWGESLRGLSFDQAVSRVLIWRTAWSAFLQYPLLGLPGQDFTSFFELQNPGFPIVSHAHNFYLDILVRYGLFGVLSLLSLILIGLRYVWLKARLKGLWFFSSVLVLQLVDVSFLFSGVLLSFVLVLNLMDSDGL